MDTLDLQTLVRMVNSTPIPLMTVNSEGTISFANPATLAAFGYRAEELIGVNVSMLLPPDEAGETLEGIAEYLDGADYSMGDAREYAAVRKDGTVMQVVAAVSAPAQSGEDRIMAIVMNDVTEKNKALDAASLLASIVEHSADSMIVRGLDGAVLSWNDAATAIYGYTREEALTSQVADLIIPDNKREELRTIVATIEAGHTVTLPRTTRRRKDGTEFAASLSASPVMDRHGRIVGAVAISRDITTEDELRKELERSNRDLEQFAYMASHDLQAPARSIADMVSLLNDDIGATLAPEQQEIMGLLRKASAKMQDQTKALLAMARVQQMPLHTQAVDLNHLITDVRLMLRSDIAASWALFEVGELAPVAGDPQHLQQVFGNLFTNAIKYRSPERELQIVVSRAPAPAGMEAVSVADNGIGIPPAQHERIFGMFERLHTDDEVPGVGLGLSVCRKIVERHGGTITVDSVPGTGTAFTITLPLA